MKREFSHPAAQATYDNLADKDPTCLSVDGLGRYYAQGYYGRKFTFGKRTDLSAFGAFMAGSDRRAAEAL